MSENKLNTLLSILDMHNIIIDIHELMLLDDSALDKLMFCDSKYGILMILKEEITAAKERMNNGFMNEWEEEMFPGIYESFINKK